MKDKRVILLILFGVIVILFNLVTTLIAQYRFPLASALDKTGFSGTIDVSKEVSEQSSQKNQYDLVRDSAREKLIYAFLICAGFFIVYGLSKFRVVVPITLGTLVVSFWVEYMVQYFPRPFNLLHGIGLYYLREFLITGAWILIPLAYYALWKKIKTKNMKVLPK